MFPRLEVSPCRLLTAVKRLLSACAVVCALQLSAWAAGMFIPAPGRVDMVYDSARDVAYITSGASVLRYHLGSNTFLPPFDLGGALKGIDLSPDGNTLVVADRTRDMSNVWVHVVDLQTGQSRRANFPRAFGEGGTFSVSFAADGSVLVTSDYEGSGWVPLRRYNPQTGAVSQLASSVRNRTMLASSGDGSAVGFAEADSSDGPFGRYRLADGSLLRREWYEFGTSAYNYEIGVNRNATQYAIPTYQGTKIYDANLLRTGVVVGAYAGPQPVGVAYHPVEDIVYFAWTQTTEVRAFETNTFTQTAALNFEHTFQHNGNHAYVEGRLRISRDGSLLFATVGGGVRYVRLYAPLSAEGASATTDEDTSVAVTLAGSVGNGVPVGFSVFKGPAHGTLSGDAPNLTYTPGPDFNGTDSFTFSTTYGQARSAPATVQITINPVEDAPVAYGQSVQTSEDTSANVTLVGADPDGGPVTYQLVVGPANGTLSGTAPNLVYTPAPNFNGADSFSFKVNDGTSDSAAATVAVAVKPVNDAPVALGRSASTVEDSAVPVALSASDVEGGALSYVIVNGPAHGTLSGAAPNLIYTPAPNYSGPDSFSFRVNDGASDSNSAAVSLSVTPVNDAPSAAADAATAVKYAYKVISVLSNDADVDGDALRVSSVTQGSAGGTVTISGGGANVTYRSRNNFTGIETFSYTVSDGRGGTSTATVTVTVNRK